MAIFHSHAGIISRSSGRSVIAASAYIGGKEIYDERQGITHNYTSKSNIIVNQILAPKEAAEWAKDSSILWNKVDKFEDDLTEARFKNSLRDEEKNAKRLNSKEEYKNSLQTAQTLEAALPIELNQEQCKILTEEYLKTRFVSRGLIVDYAIHWEKGNPHFHAMITRRSINTKGEFSNAKDREIVSKSGIKESRKILAEITNKHLELAGFDIRVDHRSFKDMGLTVEPSIHKGWQAVGLEKKGEYSRLVQENQEIRQRNIEIIFNDPSQIIKEIALKKIVFTQDDIANEIYKRVEGDETLFSILNERVKALDLPNELTLLEQRNQELKYSNKFANDNKLYEGFIDLKDQEQYLEQLTNNTNSIANKIVNELEEIVLLGTNINSKLVYTSKYLIENEKQILKLADDVYGRNNFTVNNDRITHFMEEKEKEWQQASNSGAKLSDEQREGINYLCSGENLRILIGKAGSGKTTLLKVVADSYKDAGYRVIGSSFQGKAIDIMASEIGINTYTLDFFRLAWQQYESLNNQINNKELFGKPLEYAKQKLLRLKTHQLTEKDVIIIDEANMIGSRLWKPLLEQVSRSKAKLIIVQDPSQIKAHEPGDIARGLVDKYGSFELNSILRQKIDWQRIASKHLNEHNIEDGLLPYFEKGNISWHHSNIAVYKQIAEDYVGDYEKKSDQLFLSFLNSKVNVVNKAIHNQLKEKGYLYNSIIVGDKEFSINERIVFTKNENKGVYVKNISKSEKIGVKNGTFGNISGIENKNGNTILTVKLDDNRIVKFNGSEFKDFDYGYGITINKSEGITCDNSYVLFDPRMNANLALIAMTRHKQDIKGYIVESDFEDFKDVVSKIGYSQKSVLIKDFTINEEVKPYYERIKQYKALSINVATLLEEIVNSTEDGKEIFDHKLWNELQNITSSRKNLACEILAEYDSHSLFVNQANIRKNTIEVHAGIRKRLLSYREIKASHTVESYIEIANKTKEVWNEIKATHPGWKLKEHSKYEEYQTLKAERDSIAAVMTDSASLHRQFFRISNEEREENGEIKTIKIDYDGNEIKDYYHKWSSVKYQSIDHYSRQGKLAFVSRLNEVEKEYYDTVKSYTEARNEIIAFVSDLKNKAKNSIYQFPNTPNYDKYKEQKDNRDNLALKIVETPEYYAKYWPLFNIKEDKLLEHAVMGEQRKLKRVSINNTNYEKGTYDNYNNIEKFNRKRDYDYRFNNNNNFERIILEANSKSYDLAVNLLGSPNSALCSATELRYGNKGSLMIKISEDKAGAWYDYERGEGGKNIISLIKREKGGSYKDAIKYAANYIGISAEERVDGIGNYKGNKGNRVTSIKTIESINEGVSLNKDNIEQKIAKVTKLYDQSIPVKGTLAEKYLRSHRKIEGELPESIRFIKSMYEPQTKTEMPAMVAFAKNKEGIITAGQVTYLDKENNNKAEIDINKRTYGILKGSFVKVQEGNKTDNSIYITEGIETALSIKEAGVEGKIIASLGISNIKNINKLDLKNKNIIICADNDGSEAVSNNIIVKSANTLIQAGYNVEIIKPKEISNDFNDILVKQGKEAVKSSIELSIKENEVSRVKAYVDSIDVKDQSKLGSIDYKKLDQEVIAAKEVIRSNQKIIQEIKLHEEGLKNFLYKVYGDNLNASKLLKEWEGINAEKAKEIIEAVQKDSSLLGNLRGNVNYLFIEDKMRKEAKKLSLELHTKLKKQFELNKAKIQAQDNIAKEIDKHTIPNINKNYSYKELTKIYQISNYKAENLKTSTFFKLDDKQFKAVSARMVGYTILDKNVYNKAINKDDVERYREKAEYEVKRLPKLIDDIKLRWCIKQDLPFDHKFALAEELKAQQLAERLVAIESSIYIKNTNIIKVEMDQIPIKAWNILDERNIKQEEIYEQVSSNSIHDKEYNKLFARNYIRFEEMTGKEPEGKSLSIVHIITAEQLEQRAKLQKEISTVLEKTGQKSGKDNNNIMDNITQVIDSSLGERLLQNWVRNIDKSKELNLSDITDRNHYVKFLQNESIDVRKIAVRDLAQVIYEVKHQEFEKIQKEMQIQKTLSHEITLER